MSCLQVVAHDHKETETQKMIIETRPDLPKEIADAVKMHLNAVGWLLPDWCFKVVLGYEPDAGYTVQAVVHKQYRTLYLDISTRWLDESFDTRRLVMIHEIVHCFNVPLKAVLGELIEDLELDEKVVNIVHRQMNHVMEAITQDFAIVIDRKMKEWQ